MTHPVPEWAGTAVAWDPEVPGRDFVCTVPDAGSWTVAFSDFAPQHDPISLEMRAESISQLVNGDALRCGETERVESTGASAGADIVAGRDRATVQGKLHEHTGRELVETVAHLDTSVGGSLDVHAGLDDTVLLAGHMVDTWNGGTAVVAAVADDLVAGGGLRVTAPLDVWAHGVMGVEERVVTCTADVLLLELAATHYEREYNAGVHMAALAQFVGALFVTTRTQFCPLMEVSSGVRNLISAPIAEAGGETPSPTPPPSEGGGGSTAASLTVSSATDMGRTVEAGADMATSSWDDLASLRHGHDGVEAVADTQQAVADISRMIDEDFASALQDLGDFGRTDSVSELNHAPDSAEQLASLQAGESVRMGGEVVTEQPPVITEILQAIDMQWANELDELDFGRRTDDFPDVSLLGPDGVGGTHHAGDVVDPGTGGAELDPPPSVRHDFDDWKDLLDRLLGDLAAYQGADNQFAAGAHQEAIDGIADQVLATYQRFGGNTDDLTEDASKIERAIEAYRALDDMIDEAIAAGDVQRAADIWGAQSSINVVTSEYASVLNEGFAAVSEGSVTSSWHATWSSSGSSDGSAPNAPGGSGSSIEDIPTASVAGTGIEASPPDRAPGLQSPQRQPGFGSSQTLDTRSTADVPEGWHTGETPGYGRMFDEPESLSMSRRLEFIESLQRGELMPRETLRGLYGQFSEARMAGDLAPGHKNFEAMAELLGDLQDVADRARESGSQVGDYSAFTSESWSMLTLLLAMFDQSGGTY